MEKALRAGIAIYNSGRFHAAHDAWEEPWLDLDSGTGDERLFHGLIQFTAAIHHSRENNREGAVGLAGSAREYLDGLGEYKDVNVETACEYLALLETQPALAKRTEPPALTIDGRALSLSDLDFETGAIAARVLAAEDGYDETVVTRAIEYARAALAEGRETSPFVTLVLDVAREDRHRDLVFDRLRGHVERRDARRADLSGLFESDGDRGRTGSSR